MNKKGILTVAVLAAMTAGAVAAPSPKRGVGESNFLYACQIRALLDGVSWYYNWGNTPSKGNKGQIEAFTDIEYVPMCWNGNYDSQKIRDYVAEHPGVKYILGFNEPNFKKQANLTPQEAAEKWPAVQALAAELNLQLVAPALNYSPDAPYNQPTSWMDEFYALVGPDAFDFTAIHNYGGLGVMQTLAAQFHDKYKKPVWVTEFCLWPGGAGNVYVSPTAQINSMIETFDWLEQTDYIYRYAWFKPIGASDGKNQPNYGLLETQRNETESFLTEQGKVYCNLPTYDPSLYYNVNEVIPAVKYLYRTHAGVASTNYPSLEVPVEITEFNAGATLDYQFDVPEAGLYTLVLTISGVGEPVSFDPKVAVYMVNADGSEGAELTPSTALTLTGSDTDYKQVGLPMTLSAGKVRLRLKDVNASAPSGMRIATVELHQGEASVSAITDNSAMSGDVYSIDGRRVRTAADAADPFAGLPAGIYIMNGRKFIVR